MQVRPGKGPTKEGPPDRAQRYAPPVTAYRWARPVGEETSERRCTAPGPLSKHVAPWPLAAKRQRTLPRAPRPVFDAGVSHPPPSGPTEIRSGASRHGATRRTLGRRIRGTRMGRFPRGSPAASREAPARPRSHRDLRPCASRLEAAALRIRSDRRLRQPCAVSDAPDGPVEPVRSEE